MRVSLITIVVLGAAGVLAIYDINTPHYLTYPDTQSSYSTEPGVTTDMKPDPITSSVKPVDCADHLMAGATDSGVYEIYPFTCTCTKPVLVWCDMETDGGGWTVFLNRQQQDIQLDFNRTWDDYKAGFGSPYSEYYLGNEVLHQMTYSRFYTIRLEVDLPSGGYDFTTYQHFKVDSEYNRYYASLTGRQQDGVRITECLNDMNYVAFSTLDKNFIRDIDCAKSVEGGWWYRYYDCQYFVPTARFNGGILLSCTDVHNIEVTQVQLKLRPAICDTSFKTIHLKDKNCGCADPER